MTAVGGRTAARIVAGSVLVSGVLAAVPGVAFAHGIGGSSKTVGGFVWLGTTHMLAGWDHLLFVGGVLLLAGTVRRAAKLISLFALGHSITLFTATVAEWQVNPVLVDIVVALSLVFVGVVGLIGRPKDWTWFAAAVFGFGLIHGLGLSTRLQELGLPSEGLIPRVLAFNVGVEIGQLLAVVGMYLLGRVIGRYAQSLREPRWSHGTLVVVGLVAATVLAVIGEDTQPRPTAEAFGNCQFSNRTETYEASDGHPSKDFFEPTEKVPPKTFGHILGDGFVIVHYQPTLTAEQVAQLRMYVTDPAAGRVAGGPVPGQQEAVKAVNAYHTLKCSSFDLAAVKQFATSWFDDPRSKPIE